MLVLITGCSGVEPAPRARQEESAPASTAPADEPTPAVVQHGPPRPRAPGIHVDVEDAGLVDVVAAIAGQQGRRTYVAHPLFAEETISVRLRDVPWREALDVIARMSCHTVYVAPDAVYLDHACTSGEPDWAWVRAHMAPAPVPVQSPSSPPESPPSGAR